MARRTISGEIVSSQTAELPALGKEYGYITLKTPELDHIKLKIDMDTSYETIERGEHVTVEYDRLGDTGILSARRIVKGTG